MFQLFKKKRYPELEDELFLLCSEWFDGQLGDLPASKKPAKAKIEQDALEMRDRTLRSLEDAIARSDAISKRKPNDVANLKAMSELTRMYSGHEATTPIFTKLALAKHTDDRYQEGWPLCAIRLIAESYLKQSTGIDFEPLFAAAVSRERTSR